MQDFQRKESGLSNWRQTRLAWKRSRW